MNLPLHHILTIIAFAVGNLCILAQTSISGTISNETGNPIIDATLLLYSSTDSTFMSSTTTDSLGFFRFHNVKPPYRLIIQHDSYSPLIINSNDSLLGTLTLHKKVHSLDEIVVTAPAPTMKISSEGALSYNASAIAKTNSVTNALDYLKYIPSIQQTGNSFDVVGGGKTTIIINGKKSNLNQNQIIQYLSSLPANLIKSIDVNYSTPPRFGVKGASINIILDKKRDAKSILGSIYATGKIGHYFSQDIGTSVTLSTKKWSLDLNYKFDDSKDISSLHLSSIHQFQNTSYDINHNTRQTEKKTAHNFSSIYTIDFNKKSSLSLTYIGRVSNPKNEAKSNISIFNEDQSGNESSRERINLHNIGVDFTANNFMIDFEYTLYRNKNSQNNQFDSDYVYVSKTHQKIDKFKLNIDNSNTLLGGKFQYGLGGYYSHTSNNHNVEKADEIYEDYSFYSNQKEYTISSYIGYNYRFGKLGFLNLSLQGEYFYSTVTQKNTTHTLWRNFDLFPNLTMVYRFKNNTFQFAFSSEKVYPSYWKVIPSKDFLSPYLISEGNPLLQPYNIYRVNANYILKNRYIIGIFGELSPKYSTQLLYQEPDKLNAVYKYLNFNHSNKFGLMGIIPINWNNYINSRITVNAFYMNQKGRLEGLNFNRNKICGRINLMNNFYFSSKKNLFLNVSAWYQLPSIQGIYNVSDLWDVSASFTWRPLNKSWDLTLSGNNLFDSYILRSKALYGNQNYSFKHNPHTRFVSISIKYIFNEYKEKKPKIIDTSRFGF